MNFQQIRFVQNTVLHNFNLTQAAKALFTSQPALSKGILELEEELGCAIFVRHGKRLHGLTEAGALFYESFERILSELDNIRQKSQDLRAPDQGRLVIATTHTQARYTLPRILIAFRARYPKVQLVIHQGNPSQLADFVRRGEADVAIATEGLNAREGLFAMPLYQWEHMVVVPQSHPLLKAPTKTLTINVLSHYPIITFDKAFAGRNQIDKAFNKAQIAANIVLEAIDADVIKTYVKANMGIGILPSVAFNTEVDKPLQALSAQHLFGINTTWLAVKNDVFLRRFLYDFIETCSPSLTEQRIIELRKKDMLAHH